MNWFTMAGTLLHILKNVPDLVDDVEDFFNKLTGKQAAPDEVQAAVTTAITQARQA